MISKVTSSDVSNTPDAWVKDFKGNPTQFSLKINFAIETLKNCTVQSGTTISHESKYLVAILSSRAKTLLKGK